MRRIERYKFFFHLWGAVRRSLVLRFAQLSFRDWERAWNDSLSFSRVSGEHSVRPPPGFQNMCIEARHLFHPPCRNPEGRRSPGFSLGGMAGVTRHSTKENFHLPPATETGSPAVASSQRAEQERSGRFISQEGVRGRDLCMLSPADAAHGFSFGFHSGGLCIQSDGYHSCARIRTGK